MAYKKISDLTTATMAGGELLEVEQSGTSKKTSATLTREALKVPLLNSGGYLPANGIAFPAALAASTDPNTLDDYEEGTFTPGLTFGGGSVGLTYSLQAGTYIKIGKAVLFEIALVIALKGSSTGAAVVTGLPFTKNGNTGQQNCGLNVISYTGYPHARVTASATTIDLYQTTEAGSRTSLTNTNFSDNCTLSIAGWYQIA